MSKVIRPLLAALTVLLAIGVRTDTNHHSQLSAQEFFQFGPASSTAEEPGGDEDENSEVEPTPKNAISESRLETFYLRRKEDGKLVPFFHIPFEEFDDLYQFYERSRNPQPTRAYSISNLEISGRVAAPSGSEGQTSANYPSVGGQRFAELTATVEILSLSDGWVKVPLRFDNLILESFEKLSDPKAMDSDPVADEKDGEQNADDEADEKKADADQSKASGDPGLEKLFVAATPDNTGYIVWIRADANTTHTMRIKGLRAIESSGGDSRIKLNLPPSPYSKLELEVPGRIHDARVSDDSILETPEFANGSTRLVARGPKGEFKLSWRDDGQSETVLNPSVFSTARIVARVEGRNNIRLQAEFDLESFGGKLSTVDVILPLGAELIPVDQKGVTVSLVRANRVRSENAPTNVPTSNTTNANQQVVRVRFDRSDRRPVPFSLVANRRVANDETIEMGGFVVVGALRQIGAIDLVADPKWSILQTARDATRVPVVNSEIAGQRVAARYEFEHQPYSLELKITATTSRVKIEPSHFVLVRDRSVEMQSRLACRFEGASPENVLVVTKDWQVEKVGPRSLVQSFSVNDPEPGITTILLAEAARQAFREPEIELTLRKALANSDKSASSSDKVDFDLVEFELPVVIADSVEPAILAVTSDDNIQLQVRQSELKGLYEIELSDEVLARSNQMPGHSAVSSRLDGPIGYRKISPAGEAKFSASLEVLTRKVSLNCELEVSAEKVRIPGKIPKRVLVKSNGTLNVRYDSLSALYLKIDNSHVYTVRDDSGAVDVLERRNPHERLRLRVELDGKPVSLTWYPELSDSANTVFSITLNRRLYGQHSLLLQYDLDAPVVRYADAVPFEVWHPQLLIPATATGSDSKKTMVQLNPEIDSLLVSNSPSAGAEILPDSQAWVATTDESVSGPDTRIYVPESDFSESSFPFQWKPAGFNSQESQIIDKLLCQTVLGKSRRYERVSLRMEPRDKELVVSLPLSAKLVSAYLNGIVAESGDGSLLRFDISDRSLNEHVIDVSYQMPQTSARSREVWCEMPTFADVSSVRAFYWELVTPNDEYFVHAQPGLTPLLKIDWEAGGLLARTAAMEHKMLETWVGIPAQAIPDEACNRYVFSSFGESRRYKVFVVNRRDAVLCAAAIVLLIGLIITLAPGVRHPLNLLALIVVGSVFLIRYPDLMLMLLQLTVLTLIAGTSLYLLQSAIRRRGDPFGKVYWDEQKGDDLIVLRDGDDSELDSLNGEFQADKKSDSSYQESTRAAGL